MTPEDRFERLEERLDIMQNNHLNHLAQDVATVSADVAWLKNFFWVVATASVGSFVTALFTLLLTYWH